MIRAKILAVLVATATAANAQVHQHAVGEALGTVHFATSCNAQAQLSFDHAVALLHSFQFSRAISGFDEVLQADPDCAIAHWGIALSYWGNPFAPGAKDAGQLAAGRDQSQQGLRAARLPERERGYLVAISQLYVDFDTTPQQQRLVAYRDAMQALAKKNPQDREAQIFYALALAAAEDPSDKSYADRLKAGAILEKLFAAQPSHPGLAHYIIHAYDVPALATQALDAAKRYAQIAPDAPHALHMPSHTFTRLGLWQESIRSNIAAAAAARRDGQTAEELHASDYEVYAYLQAGQNRDALRIVQALPSIAARFDPKAVLLGAGGPPVGYFALAAIPARYALERQDWRQAAALPVRPTPFPYTDAMTWFARGLGAAHLGKTVTANESVAALQSIQKSLTAQHEKYWAHQVEIQALALSAWTALAAGNQQEAVQRLTAAADLEDATEKSAVTPGPLAPARELLGQMLLEIHEPAQAFAQFEATLKKEPGRFRSLYGAAHAAQLAGLPAQSHAYFRELTSVCANADKPLADELAEAWQASSRQ